MHKARGGRVAATFAALVTTIGVLAAPLAAQAAPAPDPGRATAPQAPRARTEDVDLNRGAPVAPIPTELEQPDGATFTAVPWGDARSNGYETPDGFTVVKDAQKVWRYANGRDRNGKLKVGTTRPDKASPPPGVAKRQRPADPPPLPDGSAGAPATEGPSGPGGGGPAATPSPANTGDQKTLVILAEFDDQPHIATDTTYWNSQFFGATDSVAAYYRDASFNALDLVPATESNGTADDGVIGWVNIGATHPDTRTFNSVNQQLTADAVTAADPFINFASYDSNGNGWLEPFELHITVIVAGYETSYGGALGSCAPSVWGHRWGAGAYTPVLDGKNVGAYYTQFGEMHCATNNVAGAHPATLGIMVHELGHDLGWPDLYDTSFADEGAGEWSVMASGSWNSAPSAPYIGMTPPLPDAWSRAWQGWITPTVMTDPAATYSLGAATSSPEAVQILANPGGYDWIGSGEFFLVENRQLTGWDAGLPGCGLVVFHVDEGEGTNQSGDGDLHRLVSVVQADGFDDLGQGNNRGDGGDPFPGETTNTLLAPHTSPSSHLFSGATSGVTMQVETTSCAPSMDVTFQAPLASADLDPTFGGGSGFFAADLQGGGNFDSFADLAVQSDGKIVAVGDTITATDPNVHLFAGEGDAQVVRFNADGTLDTGFGTGGLARIDLGGGDGVGALAIQPDGKILIAGSSRQPAGCASGECDDVAVVARLTPTGALDSATFGSSGLVTTDLVDSTTDQTDRWQDIALDATDIVVAGTNGTDAMAARLTSSGGLDGTFNGGVVQTIDFGQSADIANAVTVLADSSVILGGDAVDSVADVGDLAVARLTPSGSLDSGFDSDGVVTLDRGPADSLTALGRQSDGSVVATGWSADADIGGEGDWVVLRLDPSTGALDPSFGTAGVTSIDWAGGDDKAGGLAVLADDRIVVTGQTWETGASYEYQQTTLRLTADGGIDQTFSGDGAARFSVPGATSASGNAVALDGSGRPVVAGSVFSVGPASSLVARYLADGDPTPLPTTPSISGFSPTSGHAGDTVTITGVALAGATGVSFNGTPSTSVSSSFIGTVTATVPAGATTGPISVIAPGGTVASDGDFTVVVGNPPTVTSVNPTSGYPGDYVSITGTNFLTATDVQFNGVSSDYFYVDSDTSIGAYVPDGATTGQVTVVNPDGTSTDAVTFTVLEYVTPAITGFDPTSGPPGTWVTITGTDVAGTFDVRFGGVSSISFYVSSSTTVEAEVPADAVTGTLEIENPAGIATSVDTFTVEQAVPPTITSFTPTNGVTDDYVDIYGTNLTPVSNITFNGTSVGGWSIWDTTHLTVQVPPGATTGSIVVTTPGGSAVSPGYFVVDGTPPPPDNDAFASAEVVAPPSGTVSGDSTTASREVGEPAHIGGGARSVWYSFTPTADGSATFDTEGSAFDTVIAAYTGSAVDNLDLVMADDDSGSGTTSTITFDVTSNVTFSIAVAGFSGGGAYTFNWAFTPTVTDAAPVGDFDGDGDTDIGVFRPSVGGWYLQDQPTVFFGLSGDIPIPGDYDGDGSTERAVFRPSVGGWYIEGQSTVFFGLDGDIPVPGDYDGDGTTDIAVYRPAVGGWYIIGQAPTFHGLSTDTPVPGDYDGDGTTDIAIYRPDNGGWYRPGQPAVFHGLSTDLPVPGDYDGDGTTDIAVYRAGEWLIAGQATAYLGLATDTPVPGDYDANGTTDPAVFRPDVGAWYVTGQATTYHGLNGDIPTPKRPAA
jgi:M6 family metalloprotease-like protein/uncharacterized delta-60 repeat protein